MDGPMTYPEGAVFPPQGNDCCIPQLPPNLLEYRLCTRAEYESITPKEPGTIYLLRATGDEPESQIMFLGDVMVSSAYLGEIEIDRAYLGDVLVFAETGAPYLEIEPELIWVYPDIDASNNVYSNTTWNIN